MLLQMALFHSFLWLSNIPLYICTTSSLPIPLRMDIWVASMFGYCVNSVAMNIRVHVSFQIIIFSVYMPRSGIAGSHGNSCFQFFRNPILFFIVAAAIYIPTSSVGGFPFLHTLSSICYLQTL